MVVDFAERRSKRKSAIEITGKHMETAHRVAAVLSSRGVPMVASRETAEDGRSYVVIAHRDDPDRFWQVVRDDQGAWVLLDTQFQQKRHALSIDALLLPFVGINCDLSVIMGGTNG